jgi:hypothetical protein
MLDPRDVRQANAAGALNFVILHFGLVPDLDTSAGQGSVAAAEAGFRLAHGGYRVRRMLQEAHGPRELAMLTGAGLRLKSDYGGYFAARRIAEPPAGERVTDEAADLLAVDASGPGSTRGKEKRLAREHRLSS